MGASGDPRTWHANALPLSVPTGHGACSSETDRRSHACLRRTRQHVCGSRPARRDAPCSSPQSRRCARLVRPPICQARARTSRAEMRRASPRLAPEVIVWHPTVHCRIHERGELSSAGNIGLDSPASVGLRHTRGRPSLGPRPAFGLPRNLNAACQETRFARSAGPAASNLRWRRVRSRSWRCAGFSPPPPALDNHRVHAGSSADFWIAWSMQRGPAFSTEAASRGCCRAPGPAGSAHNGF